SGRVGVRNRRGELARFPLFRGQRRETRARRVFELRVGGGAAGSVFEGGGAGEKPRNSTPAPDDRESRLRARLPSRHQRRSASGLRRIGPRLLAGGPSRTAHPADRRGVDRTRQVWLTTVAKAMVVRRSFMRRRKLRQTACHYLHR